MRIWITRSEPGATALAAALASAGHVVFKAPVLEVRRKPFAVPQGSFDLGIFLSAQAVRFAAAKVAGSMTKRFAIGRQTQAALQEVGFDSAAPQVETSEGLLAALPDTAGKSVLVVAGVGGRNRLLVALAEQGAQVTRIDAYARYPVSPAVDTERVDLMVVSSGDGFAQAARLWIAAGGNPNVPVLAPSARVASLAASLGMASAYDCGGAGAAAVLSALQRGGFERDGV